MSNGTSAEAKANRRHLFEFNYEEVLENLISCIEFDDPVGLIIEMTDDQGKQIAYSILESQGMAMYDIAEMIAAHCKNNSTPTLKILIPMDFAKPLLSSFTSNASEVLSGTRLAGNFWIVVIGSGGNSYVQVSGQSE